MVQQNTMKWTDEHRLANWIKLEVWKRKILFAILLEDISNEISTVYKDKLVVKLPEKKIFSKFFKNHLLHEKDFSRIQVNS